MGGVKKPYESKRSLGRDIEDKGSIGSRGPNTLLLMIAAPGLLSCIQSSSYHHLIYSIHLVSIYETSASCARQWSAQEAQWS